MRLAFIYGPFSIGARPFDLTNLFGSPRGMTGSEISCFRYAKHMAARGHEVVLALAQPCSPAVWEGVQVTGDLAVRGGQYAQRPDGFGEFDAVISWNEPAMLDGLCGRPLRVVDQQLNDFDYCLPGWERNVDLLLSPSQHHLDYLLSADEAAARIARRDVLPNGCDPNDYEFDTRLNDPYDAKHSTSTEILIDRPREISGRVIWASSADRGLHLLLQCWPEIKRKVPNASLRCYYHWSYDGLIHWDASAAPDWLNPDIVEIAQRARYIRHALEVLKPLDVVHHGGVSRDEIRDAFSRASVFAYPCDTIRYTEGFSVSTMEACAAGCVPVISECDALPSIYEGLPMVKSPAREHLREFVRLVVKALTDHQWAESKRAEARKIAEQHSWDKLARRLEGLLHDEIAKRREAAE